MGSGKAAGRGSRTEREGGGGGGQGGAGRGRERRKGRDAGRRQARPCRRQPACREPVRTRQLRRGLHGGQRRQPAARRRARPLERAASPGCPRGGRGAAGSAGERGGGREAPPGTAGTSARTAGSSERCPAAAHAAWGRREPGGRRQGKAWRGLAGRAPRLHVPRSPPTPSAASQGLRVKPEQGPCRTVRTAGCASSGIYVAQT